MIKSISFEGYKGQSQKVVELGRLNLLTGPNGSRKTATYEAIHIALKGKHPTAGDTLQAIKPYCSGEKAVFEFVGDDITVRREIVFGEKTTHTVFINNEETKVKEAQNIIDEYYTDSMMRLDIGKFSKMNDLERGVVLSDLLGSVKVNAADVVADILNLYYRSNPESDYVIKYRLDKTNDNYEKKEFIAVMREQYAEKNPVILEMLDTCEKILSEHTGVVELAEMMDDAYESVKKFRNAKNMEKQYAQKALSEISADNVDPQEVDKSVKEINETLTRLDSKIRSIIALIEAINAWKPTSDIDVLEKDIADYNKKIDEKNAAILALEKKRGENAKAGKTLADALEEHRRYAQWKDTQTRYENAIKSHSDQIQEHKNKLSVESSAKLKDLESDRAAYMSLKELVAGECPLCGTTITEKAVVERKEKIKEAKARHAVAEKELKTRQTNAMLKSSILLLEKQLKETQDLLKNLKNENIEKPQGSAEEMKSKLQEIAANDAQALTQTKEYNREIASMTSERAFAVAEKEKHSIYAKKLIENEALLDMCNADKANPMPKLEEALEKLRNEQKAEHDKLAGYLASAQMNEKLKTEQARILDLQVAYETLGTVATIIRTYKNNAVERKVEPVQLLASKYYHNKTDNIVITPKTIGIVRNGINIPQSALSSGESLSLMSAVLISIMESSGAKPNYLFVDAAEIDADNIQILLNALEKSGLETIIVAHHMPIKASEAWNHISMGG